jgi:hypothetical protein
MDEIGSYVACIVLPVAEIWYWRFLRGSGEATTCPCGLFVLSEPCSTRLAHQGSFLPLSSEEALILLMRVGIEWMLW